LRSSPRALADAKTFTSKLLAKTPREGGELAKEKLLQMLRDPAVVGGVNAFQEGSVPNWFSRFRPAYPLALSGEPKRPEIRR
jgi:methylglutaconyl-CoA hydratase/polyketide biosynthesis enoyl-CoA hydratase PksH